MEREKLLVSFSGGETSAYMAQWLWNNKRDKYDMIVVFANTGQENEETLDFVRKFSLHYNIPVVWVEAKVFYDERKSTGFITTDYFRASRDGEPFEDVIIKYGIPNNSFPHCTRELKLNPIRSYAKSIGWKDYYTAVGIRRDEISRINTDIKENKIIYPLASKNHGKEMTKPDINEYWSNQSFRLMLKGYQGNCKVCFKKSDNKLFQIAKENPSSFSFFDKMEEKYKNYIPDGRRKAIEKKGKEFHLPVYFYRKNRSVMNIISESKSGFKSPKNDSEIYPQPQQMNLFDDESCEIFSDCGNN